MTALARRRLGTAGPMVSVIALGSWRTFERMDRGDAEHLLAYALAAGIDFLDDARYDDETGQAPLATGYSEVLFGELCRAVGVNPTAVTVSNKLWWEFWPRQDAVGELEGSLERMGFDRIGLLYASTLPEQLPVQVAVEQIAAALATGRVDHWGMVNWSADQIAAAGREAKRLGLAPPSAVQLPYSLARLDWVEEAAMQAALQSTGATLVASATLAGGALTGKYARGAPGRLSDQLADPRSAHALAVGARLAEHARALGVAPASLAIAFALSHPRSTVLIGATTPAQIDDAVAAVTLAEALSPDELAALRALACVTA